MRLYIAYISHISLGHYINVIFWSKWFLFVRVPYKIRTVEMSMLPVSGLWRRVFHPSGTLSIAQFSTGAPQLWACAKTSIKRSASCFCTCLRWACHVRHGKRSSQASRVIETHLKYYPGCDRRGMFYGLFMHEVVSLWQGPSTVTSSCHAGRLAFAGVWHLWD